MKNGYIYIMQYTFKSDMYYKIGKSIKHPNERAIQIIENTNHAVKAKVILSWKVKYYSVIEKAIQYMLYKYKIKIVDGNPDGWTELYENKDEIIETINYLLPTTREAYICILENNYLSEVIYESEKIKNTLLKNNTYSKKILDKEMFPIIKKKLITQFEHKLSHKT